MNIDSKQFYDLLKEGKPLLVDFWAPWCSYCRRINPAYEQISQQYADKVAVVKINIDDERALSDAEQIEVIPTLVLYKGGQAVASIVAPESKARIDQFLRENL